MTRRLPEWFIRRYFYPWHYRGPRRADPTYGRIDRDLQWKAHDMKPTSQAQRVALENTLQNKRDRS